MAKQIKSSIELAMEKMAKLPKLTKDEIRERQEKEYAPQGQALARDLLTGVLAETRLEVELFKHEDERGRIVRKAFSASLCQAINLEDAETTAKVCNAIKLLVHDDHLEEAARLLDGPDGLDGLLRDYERQKQQELAAIEEAEGACVRDLGVSGSAIRLNPRENERWRQKWSELQQAFRPQADEIKRELTDHLASSLLERS
ncbi:MAG: hypothetical protein JRS35_14780 [Deltaproteobacteria bacterium]|nr:hypothetical protein [Deltaproteobacteria bacterium]